MRPQQEPQNVTERPLDTLNRAVGQIKDSVLALNTAHGLQGGEYSAEQRLNSVEKLLSAGLVALSVAAEAIGELTIKVEVLEARMDEGEPEVHPNGPKL